MKLVQNKKMIFNNEKWGLDTPPKYVKYYPQIPAANWARAIITHSPNDNIDLELYLRFYKN